MNTVAANPCPGRDVETAVFHSTVEIAADSQTVWSAMVDVERWPEWTASVSRVKVLTPGPLRTGSRVRIHQPRFPPAYWRVTEIDPGQHFTWISVAPGIRVSASHGIASTPTGTRVTLSIAYQGLVGRWLARMTRRLNERYLAMEAEGLKARCAGAGRR